MDDSAPIQSCLKTLYASLDEAVSFIERLPPRPDGRRDYRYLGMNAAMLRMFGIEDLTGQAIRDNFPTRLKAGTMIMTGRSIPGGRLASSAALIPRAW